MPNETMALDLPERHETRFLALRDVAATAEVLRDNLAGETLNEFMLPQIKVPAGGGQVWTIPTIDGEETAKTITGVILVKRHVRGYWINDIAAGGNAPPDCSSPDARVGFGSIWEQGKQDCLTCPYAQWGSKVVNGIPQKGQACKAAARVFLLREGDTLPIVLTVSPASLKAFSQYVIQLTAASIPTWGIETTFGLEKRTNDTGIVYSGITFRAGSRLSEQDREAVARYRREIETTVAAQQSPLSADDLGV